MNGVTAKEDTQGLQERKAIGAVRLRIVLLVISVVKNFADLASIPASRDSRQCFLMTKFSVPPTLTSPNRGAVGGGGGRNALDPMIALNAGAGPTISAH